MSNDLQRSQVLVYWAVYGTRQDSQIPLNTHTSIFVRGKKCPYIVSWFNPLNSDTFYGPSVSVVTGFDCTFLLSYFRTLSICPASCTSPSYSQTLYRVSLSFRFKVETHHRRFSSVHVLRAEPKCNLRRKRMKGMGEVGHGSRSPPLSSSLLSTPLDLILFTLNPLLSPPSQITPPFWGWKLRGPPFSFKSPLPLIILH